MSEWDKNIMTSRPPYAFINKKLKLVYLESGIETVVVYCTEDIFT